MDLVILVVIEGKVTDYKEAEKEIGLRQTERERITANNYPFSFHS